jgi:transcriptional regulator with XRE-family HTH domain
MSTEVLPELDAAHDVPELTLLGKRLEILRIERGVSKQGLARHAGTSRQQLWRVMTGKSELTTSLRARLAAALSIDPATLSSAPSAAQSGPGVGMLMGEAAESPPFTPATVSDYLNDATRVVATLRTLPSGDGGRRLKRALLNAVEDLAVESGGALPLDYSEIRRRVLAGEL